MTITSFKFLLRHLRYIVQELLQDAHRSMVAVDLIQTNATTTIIRVVTEIWGVKRLKEVRIVCNL